MPTFCPKNVYSQKRATLMPIFCQKKVHSLENTMLSCNLFQFFLEKPLLLCPYLVKMTSILSKLHYIMDKKSIGCPFADFVWRKKNCSHANILSEKCQFSKKHDALMPIFCQKIAHSLNNKLLHVIFFKIFMKKPLPSCPSLVQKTSILSKLDYIMGQKSQKITFFGGYNRLFLKLLFPKLMYLK